VYVQLSDGIGEYRLSAEFHDLIDGTVVARSELGRIKWEDRPAGVNLIIPVHSMEMGRAGTYDLIVFADDQEIDRQSFTVAVSPDNDNGKET
jgi:hypothetical protein